MKRLTEYTIPETGFSVVSEEKYKRIMMEEKPSVEKVYNRLKKIEDILGDEYGLDRLRELGQADREGRCVVLPCKVEDDVYINILGRTLPFTVISISQMASTPKGVPYLPSVRNGDYRDGLLLLRPTKD